MKDRGLTSCFDIVTIERITSIKRKVEFIEKYIRIDSESNVSRKSFEKLPTTVIDVLDHPALLTMAFVCMKRNVCIQDQLTNEQSLFAAIFRVLFEETEMFNEE